MQILGEMLIGSTSVKGSKAPIQAVNPATAELLEPIYAGGGQAEVDQACALAAAAFDTYRETSPEARAAFLEEIANQILALGDDLIVRAMAESGLPRMRLEGERGRTMGQLRMFAGVVRSGNYLDVRIDPAMPERAPLPRADLRLRNIALGPVAVFGASNFPLAFSVGGGYSLCSSGRLPCYRQGTLCTPRHVRTCGPRDSGGCGEVRYARGHLLYAVRLRP